MESRNDPSVTLKLPEDTFLSHLSPSLTTYSRHGEENALVVVDVSAVILLVELKHTQFSDCDLFLKLIVSHAFDIG